jgi:hypothetical protein
LDAGDILEAKIWQVGPKRCNLSFSYGQRVGPRNVRLHVIEVTQGDDAGAGARPPKEAFAQFVRVVDRLRRTLNAGEEG